MNEPWWAGLLREQQAAGFPDFHGAEGWLRLPVSDRFVTDAILRRLPRSAPISELDVLAEAANQFSVRVRLARPSFLPPFRFRFAIVQQPVLPQSPVLVLRLLSQGIAALAGPAMRFFQALPPGVRMGGDRIDVDLAALAAHYAGGEAAAAAVRYVTHLEVTTEPGRVVLAVRART